jgi:hypothetical protein
MNDAFDPVLDALWKKVLDEWEDDKRHAAFIEHCRAVGGLAEAAARYRGMAGDRERGPEAEKRLKSILAVALVELEALRTPAPERSSRTRSIVLTLLFMAATLGILAYLGATR